MSRRWKLGANISNDPGRAAADVALLASLGGRVARTSQEQSASGTPSQRLAPYRKACDDLGVELVQCCQTTGHVVPKTQAQMDTYAENVSEYASVADRTSTGNEVNGFGSNETPNPKGQAEIVIACQEAIAKHAPGRKLLTPSVCPGSGKLGQNYVEPLLFVTTMIAAEPQMLRGGIEIDWHGYCDSRYPATTAQTWNTAYRQRALHDDLVKFAHPAMRICISEFGAATGPTGWVQRVDPATQALRFDQYLQEFASQIDAGVHIGEAIWYQLRDNAPANPTDWPSQCGLVDAHGAPKPIATRFTAAAKLKA